MGASGKAKDVVVGGHPECERECTADISGGLEFVAVERHVLSLKMALPLPLRAPHQTKVCRRVERWPLEGREIEAGAAQHYVAARWDRARERMHGPDPIASAEEPHRPMLPGRDARRLVRRDVGLREIPPPPRRRPLPIAAPHDQGSAGNDRRGRCRGRSTRGKCQGHQYPARRPCPSMRPPRTATGTPRRSRCTCIPDERRG
jgi:hypothetical protein